MRKIITAFILVIVAALATPASAALFPNLVTNGSFENTTNSVTNGFPSSPYGHFFLYTGNTSISNWNITNNVLHNNPQGYYARSAYQGNWSIDLTGAPTNAGMVSQTLSTPTVSGKAYQAVFAIGVADDGPWGGYTPTEITFSTTIKSGYSKAFTSNDTATTSGDYPGVTGASNILWKQKDDCFVADTNNPAPQISFQNTYVGSTIWAFLDDVRLYNVDNCLTPSITITNNSHATEFVPGIAHKILVTPNEPLYGFDATDLASFTVTNGTLSGFAMPDKNGVYSFMVTPIAAGTTTITIPAGAAYDNDPVRHYSTASNTLTMNISPNLALPTVVAEELSVNGVVSAETNAYPGDTITYHFTASEPIYLPDSVVTIAGVVASCAAVSTTEFNCTVNANSYAVGTLIGLTDIAVQLYDAHAATATYTAVISTSTVRVTTAPIVPTSTTTTYGYRKPIPTTGTVATSVAAGSCGDVFLVNYKKGMRGDGVRPIQEFLNRVYPTKTLVVDGVFGSATEKLVRAFQLDHAQTVLATIPGNKSTGLWYPNTRAAANKVRCTLSALAVTKQS